VTDLKESWPPSRSTGGGGRRAPGAGRSCSRAVVLALGVLYALRAQQAFSHRVETTTVAVSRDVRERGTPSSPPRATSWPGARRSCSSKIQGRLAELRVEEGSVVRRGEVIARLESIDYEARCARRAAVQRAEADLAEYGGSSGSRRTSRSSGSWPRTSATRRRAA